MARGVVLAVLAVIVTTMSACDVNGEESPTLSREEYVRQVNAIYCESPSGGPPPPDFGDDLEEYATYTDDQVLPLFEKLVRQIRELQPPAALVRDADRFVRSLERYLSKLRAERDAAKRGNLQEVVVAGGNRFASGLIVRTRALDLGLRDC